ncbi:ZmpA/ZmpB/ZmpC family metallo-endopeptidase [Streptococcus suis]|uniref:ZmpA/ZmpB/ZmpC family metallo-endopeptidase n=2 Tax=Streptococcus suis TaxID=1307 RepID=UPI001C945376|nr:ZmpA/ZmpB/ZmpC family metallo-endopeptidase [Streptococcus suis]MBY4976107.1 YSIRK-type signal peptide-containing protein [Streptococcus suis]
MNLHFLQKKQHFGIRKFSIGVVSVALAISFSVAGGQVAAAQEASQTLVSSQQTSQAVTDQANQLQETNEVTVQIPETVGSSLNQATQENPAQESQLVEVEPAIQKEVVSQDISAPQAALPTEAGQEQTAEEQSNTAGDESTLTVENSHQIIEQVEPKSIQTAQEPAGSTDEVTQPVQPTETAAVEEVVQPVRRSARRARSVAAQELAKLPLDANGKLVTSLTNQSAVKLQTVFADGTSQIEEANAANLPRIKNGQNISELVSAVSPELKAVDYESLYEHLNHSERPLEKILLEQALKKENGGKALTDEEMSQRKRQVYMDQLDMRDSFNAVQTNLDSILAGVFEKTTTVDANTIKVNKEKILLGLTYLDRQYGFQFGNFSAKDLILYHPEVFGNSSEPLTNLLAIGDLAYADLELRNNLVTYQRKLSSITNHADAIQFIESQVPRWTGQEDVSAWFKDTSKAYIVEASSPHGQTKLYTTLRDSQRWQNHILPLLNLSDDSLYAISTTNTITYGAVDTYLAEKNDSNRAALKTTIADYATHQQAFLDFWYRISEQSERLKTYEPIIVTDSLQAYSTGKASAEQLWSPKSGPKALTGVQEFIGPMNLYINFVRAGGQANGTNSMNNFLYKSLTNDGHAVYTHELTHMLDKTVWLNGHGRRPDQLQEVFARGLFESLNMSASPTSDPIFNLNTAYTISGDRTQNGHPSRFQTSTDLKTYMQGMLDVLYTLDYAEAQSILKKAPDERAVLLNKISLIPNPANNGGGKTTEIVNSIDTTSAANLQTIADFVDQGLISGRYKFNGMETRGTARTNSYYTIPLFEPIYAALQNDSGSGGDISFKRNAYEILGEYGYEKGMVAYLSDQYANDKEALAAIMPEFDGNLATFKKAMFNRRIAKVSELKPTSVASDFTAIQTKMDEAIAKDLQQLKVNANNNVLLSTGVNAVRELKNQIFQAYLKDTNEFRTSIYSQPKARELYVIDGAETSTDGQGTETNPYQSLSYALSQAKDGDTIKLVSDIIHRDGQNFSKNFVIDKAVTIDGRGNKLNLRGLNLLTTKDVTLTNLKLEMIPDGGQQPKIYADGNHLTFNNVSTTISQAQTDLRPILIAGSPTDNPSGSHARISIIGGSSDTRFHQIFAGNAQGASLIPVDIVIDSEFAMVDQGIDLGGVDGNQTLDRVTLESNSSNIKKVVATNSSDNQVSLKATRIYGLDLVEVQELALQDQANITLSNRVSSISTRLEVEKGSLLNLDMDQNLQVGELSGDGQLIIPASSNLQVTGDIQGSVQVLVRGFEQDLTKNIDKEYVRVEGLLSPTARITLEKGYNRFDLVQDGVAYRLIEPTQTPQDIQVQLRFKDGERVVKEESLTLPVGSSVTDLGDRLPQLDLGHYEISSSFDQTQLNNLQTSQIIDIPLELITPALPVKVFDKTAVTGLELVILPTKTDYRPAETVDLAGLQVKLVDNQGLSKTIIPDQFGEYGVELVPVTLTPQVTSLQVRKDTHELAIPIQVIPWKADVYAVTVGEKHVYETDDDLSVVGNALLAKVQVDAQAGPVEKGLVNPLPTTLGEHSVPVLVRFDDGSQKRVEVTVQVVPASLQIHLRFKEGERLVKEESLTLPVGSSVTDLAARLPRPVLGHYVIASRFDRSQLDNLQTSKTVDIPLDLVTPTFDKTAVTVLELVTPPTKTDYRPAETVDLAGLQVKLVDNQGLSKTITPDQFGEYGVELVPVTLIPQVTGLQVRKDTHEVTIPIQVIPWKADVYSVHVGDKHVYETDDDLSVVGNALLAKVQVDVQAGSVEKSFVNPLPTTLGEHNVPVLVRFDDGSQKRVEVAVEVVPANLQINLRFKEGERLVKEESVTLQAGSSVTDLANRLPQPDLGHYVIASSFDQTQLNNIQTSKTIEIPLELVTPVKVFDKTAVTGLELVILPTKTDYRPAETVDLSGLQVKLVDNQGLSKTITPDQFGEYGVELVPVTLTPQVTSLQVRKDTHEVAIPIQVIPWKADIYAVTVGEKHVYETDDNLLTVETALLAKVQVDAQAGPVEKGLVNPLPTTLGEHSVPVLVRFDDGSQKRVSIQVVVQQTAHGEGVTHELPIGVLPKSDRYQPQVTGEARVLPTSSTEEIKAEIVKQISLPTEAGQVVYELVSNLPQTNGDYPITVRVIYDDLSQEELEVPLHILTIKNGEVVKHSLPEGVLPKSDRYQPQVTSEARVLPNSSTEEIKAEIVKQISLPTEAGQVVYELVSNLPQTNGDYPITVRVIYDDRSQDEIVVPLHIFKMENGKGVTHELPVGVLPKSDRYQPQVTSEARVLPNSSTEEIKAEIVKQISLPTEAGQVVYELVSNLPQTNGDYPITVRVIYDDRSQDEIVVPLHIFKMENGKGVTHELPIGVLPSLEVALEKGLGENSPKPAAKETTVSVSVVGQQKFAKGQLPKTGDRNNLLLVGVMLAIFNLIFWMLGKKPHQVEEK